MKRLAHYSQHFLRSPNLVKELIGHSNLTKNDIVYDIGAGSGVITSVLATRVKRVLAIEYEPRTAAKLQENMSSYPNVTVMQGDVMTLPIPTGSYKIFANIPFHLSSPIVRRFSEASNPPEAIYLIVQKQFAQKIVPSDQRFTAQLGIILAPLYAARIRKRLQRTDFWPHPNVDTVLLELIRHPKSLIAAADLPAYRKFVTDCFSTPKIFAATPRAAVGISLERKPSELTPEQWIALYSRQQAALLSSEPPVPAQGNYKVRSTSPRMRRDRYQKGNRHSGRKPDVQP